MNIIKEIKRTLRKIDIYNWIRYRTWNRYHVLKMRYLKPGWHDEDELLIHSMFEVLSQFVDGENEYHIVDWSSDPLQEHAWEEMNILYEWWKQRQKCDYNNPLFKSDVKAPSIKKGKPTGKYINPITKKEEQYFKMEFSHQSPEEAKIWNKACEDSWIFEEKCDKEDEEMMIRLIKIKQYLWT